MEGWRDELERCFQGDPAPLNTDIDGGRDSKTSIEFPDHPHRREEPRSLQRGPATCPRSHSESAAENALSAQREKQPSAGPLTNGPRSPSLSNPGSPKAASCGKQGQESTTHRGILISLCQSALSPASQRPEFSRLSAAQRTPAGTAGCSWRGKRAVPRDWGPAKRLMEHSWVGPPGWRRREAARARLLPGH